MRCSSVTKWWMWNGFAHRASDASPSLAQRAIISPASLPSLLDKVDAGSFALSIFALWLSSVANITYGTLNDIINPVFEYRYSRERKKNNHSFTQETYLQTLWIFPHFVSSLYHIADFPSCTNRNTIGNFNSLICLFQLTHRKWIHFQWNHSNEPSHPFECWP